MSGRPSMYTPELGEQICDMVATAMTLDAVCRELELKPRTVRTWLNDEGNVLPSGDTFLHSLARAREDGADAAAQRALDALRDAPSTKEEVARARELAQHYRWLASMLDPARYSEKRQVNVTGGQSNTLTIRWMREGDAQAAHKVIDVTPENGGVLPLPPPSSGC